MWRGTPQGSVTSTTWWSVTYQFSWIRYIILKQRSSWTILSYEPVHHKTIVRSLLTASVDWRKHNSMTGETHTKKSYQTFTLSHKVVQINLNISGESTLCQQERRYLHICLHKEWKLRTHISKIHWVLGLQWFDIHQFEYPPTWKLSSNFLCFPQRAILTLTTKELEDLAAQQAQE
jgi:hypothetical protein